MRELRADCRLFVASDEARTPIDFERELGAKTHSYWGEPVCCAEQLRLTDFLVIGSKSWLS